MKQKTATILFTLLLISNMLGAQVKENESAIVYYMPLTELVFEIEYEQVTEEKGMFYQYSERYLGTKEAITADAVSYRLTNVSMRVSTQADTERAYVVPVNQKTIGNCAVSLNQKSILKGINLTDDKPAAPAAQKKQCSNAKCATGEETTSNVMPLLEEQMLAGSIGKMAESTAKLIYTIRENRLNLLCGDVEHTPSDGKAMQLVLQEMEKQETALVQLFTGKRSIKKIRKTIVLRPTETLEDYVLFRFSKHAGVVDSDDLSGEPYLLTLNAIRQTYAPQDETRKVAPASNIYQNIPGAADIVLTDGNNTIIQKHIQVAQFGVAVPLAADLFTKRKTRVVFNTSTGMVKEIK